MEYLVAIASSDGKVVNQHFGHAEQFVIVKVKDYDYHYFDKRSTEAACQMGEHNDRSMEQVIEALSDCKYVLCARIGLGAEKKLWDHGIIPLEVTDLIDEAMKKLIKYSSRRSNGR